MEAMAQLASTGEKEGKVGMKQIYDKKAKVGPLKWSLWY